MADERRQLVYKIVVDSSNVAKKVDQVNANLKKLDRSVNSIRNSFNKLVGAYFALQGIGVLTNMADEYITAGTKIRLVTKDINDQALAMNQLRNIANSTMTSFDSEVKLYNRLSMAAEKFNLDTEENILLTEAFANTLRIAGGTGQEASSSMIQFAQAIGSGRLQGDELRSILENNLIYAQLLAKELKTDVGQLKILGAEGKITADIALKALVNNMAELRAEARAMPPTLSAAFTLLRNNAIALIGWANEATGFYDAIVGSVVWLGKNLNRLMAVMSTLAAVAGVFVVSLTSQALITSTTALAVRFAAIATSMGITSAGLIALPIIIAAASYAVYKMWTSTDAIATAWSIVWNRIKSVSLELTNFVADFANIPAKFAIIGRSIKDAIMGKGFSLDKLNAEIAAVENPLQKWAKDGIDALEDEYWTLRDLLDLQKAAADGGQDDLLDFDITKLEALFAKLKKGVGSLKKDTKEIADPLGDLLRSTSNEIELLRTRNSIEKEFIKLKQQGVDVGTDPRSVTLNKALVDKYVIEYKQGMRSVRETARETYMFELEMAEHVAKTSIEYADLAADMKIDAYNKFQEKLREIREEEITAQRELYPFLDALYKATDDWSTKTSELLGAAIDDWNNFGDAVFNVLRSIVREITNMGAKTFLTDPLFGLVRQGINSQVPGALGPGVGAPISSPTGDVGLAKVTIVNVLDKSEIVSAMGSAEGQRVIYNTMSRRRA